MSETIPLKTVFRDADSNKVSLTVTDSTVDFEKVSALREDGKEFSNLPEGTQQKAELFFMYSALPQREHRIHIKSRLKSTPSIRRIHWLILAALLGTIVVALCEWLDLHRRITAPRLALLLTPTTFAAALLLVRETSPLGSQFTRPIRAWIATLLAFLWGGVGVAFSHQSKIGFLTRSSFRRSTSPKERSAASWPPWATRGIPSMML
ncbi:hypothetical protein AB5J72_43295 [Streptomyces sp. CG1]|uniref:hypothetical protein n=1 Tax=Streptomyces sp. CG1 TaxID=1287523 RepID=UPI0034E20BA0